MSSSLPRVLAAMFVPAVLAVAAPTAAAATCDGIASASSTGTPEVLSGCGDLTVANLAPALGVDTLDLDRLGAPVSTPSGRVVRLQQSVDGVPVFDGQVALSYDRSGNLDMVQSSAIPEPQLSTTPRLSPAAAIAIARAAAPTGTDAQTPTAQLVVYPADAGPILAWHVARPTVSPSADLNAIVDANSGALVRSWNAAQDATAAGMVFDPNPVQTSGDTSLTDGPAPGVDTDTNTAPDAFRASVTLDHLANTTSLNGEFADVIFPVTAAPGNFSRAAVSPASASFEAVNTYYAITEAQKKIQDLGFTDVNNRSIQLLVNGDPQDNSNYNPTTQAITYGFGGVDDAEDAEVVIHEYGHAVQDNQVPGFGSGDEQGAMGEGFGDFLAGMLYMNRGDSAYEATHRYCIAEWDATSYNPVDPSNPGSGCLRWINGTDESTGDDIGQYTNTPDEVHNDGRFWSAGMTCIFEGLGGNLAARDKALKLVIDSQQSLVPIADNTAFEAQIAAMISSDQNLYNGDDVGLIRNCAADRGLATLAATDPGRDKTPPEVTAKVDPAVPDGANGFYTGNVKVSWSVVDKESTATTNGCAPVKIDSDTGDSGVTLTCTATSQGGVTSKSVTIKRRAKGSGSAGDDKPPETTIGKHPHKRTRRGHARFQFKSSEDGSSFECSLDGARFANCHSPVKVKVNPGDHTFEIRATDAAGNVEKDPATFSWTVKSRKHHRR
jgi:hypothetical protein